MLYPLSNDCEEIYEEVNLKTLQIADINNRWAALCWQITELNIGKMHILPKLIYTFIKRAQTESGDFARNK